MRDKFSFLYEDISFDVIKCKFIVKNSIFKMLVVLQSIFVADTNMNFIYNFVAPLKIKVVHKHKPTLEINNTGTFIE